MSCTPVDGASERLMTLKPKARLGVGGVIAFSYSEILWPAGWAASSELSPRSCSSSSSRSTAADGDPRREAGPDG